MEFIGLVLSDLCWGGRPELWGKLQDWPQCCSSFKLRLQFVGWGLRSLCFASVHSGESITRLPGLFEEAKYNRWWGLTLCGKISHAAGNLPGVMTLKDLWVLPPHPAMHWGRQRCPLESSVSAAKYLIVFLTRLLLAASYLGWGPSSAFGSQEGAPRSPGIQSSLPVSAHHITERGC